MLLPNSVVICTHSPRADYFGDVVEALRAQTLPTEQRELIVVDNRSDPPVEGRFDFAWHPHWRLVREETLGLTLARLMGIREASGEMLIFVDDDNVLDPDYLQEVTPIAAERPCWGGWSGQCRGGFEEPPPVWTHRYWGYLVIREFDRDVWSNLPRLPETMPCRAGMVVGRTVARHYLALHQTGGRRVQLDRTGSSLLSGGDNDLASCATDLGLGVGLFTALKLTHLISPGRFTESYLSRLAEGIYMSAVLIAHARDAKAEVASYRVRGRDWLRALENRGPHRNIQLEALRGRCKGLALVKSLGLPDA
jgi:glycosyltransferase involved in cell wall biosynthesis